MSETIEQGARADHHGALREALLNAAREIVRRALAGVAGDAPVEVAA